MCSDCKTVDTPMSSGTYADTRGEQLDIDVTARTVVHTYQSNGSRVRSEYSMGSDTTSARLSDRKRQIVSKRWCTLRAKGGVQCATI